MAHRQGIKWPEPFGPKFKNNFETSVVNAFSGGAQELEMSEPGRYYFAGAIPLWNSCLKCHLPHRTSLEERVAALVISMPLSN